MKFVYASGLLAKARRFVSRQANVYEEDVKSTGKLTELLRGVMKRLSDIEARLPPEATEFEVNVGSSGTVSLRHDFNGPVRWYVVTWTQVGGVTIPAATHQLVQDATSDANVLVLRTYAAGRAVIRVEQAFGVLDLGQTVDLPTYTATEYALVTTSQQDTTSTSQVNTPLRFGGNAGDTFEVTVTMNASSTSASGMRFSVDAPSGSAVNGEHYSFSTTFSTPVNQLITAINTAGSAVHTVAGGFRGDTFVFYITFGDTGVAGISFAAVAGTASIAAGARLFAKKATLV